MLPSPVGFYEHLKRKRPKKVLGLGRLDALSHLREIAAEDILKQYTEDEKRAGGYDTKPVDEGIFDTSSGSEDEELHDALKLPKVKGAIGAEAEEMRRNLTHDQAARAIESTDAKSREMKHKSRAKNRWKVSEHRVEKDNKHSLKPGKGLTHIVKASKGRKQYHEEMRAIVEAESDSEEEAPDLSKKLQLRETAGSPIWKAAFCSFEFLSLSFLCL